LVLALAMPAAVGASPPRVVSVGMTVSDLDRSIEFFTRVLDFEQRGETIEIAGDAYARLTGVFGARARVATVCLGTECLELTDFIAPEGRTIPADSRSNDRWFQHVAIVVSDMDAAYARLRAAGIEHVSTAPQRLPDWNPNAGGIVAFYFRDADDHNLELIWYPPGKGDPRWQERSSASSPGRMQPGAQSDRQLFLGIDHTAIAVADTGASLAFWRDALGLAVAGGAENWGVEQEHLNQVFGARLRITGLKGASGIGVEFLEYLSPSNGRVAPADLAVNDLAHWQVRLELPDATSAADAARAARGRWVSPGEVALPDRRLGFAAGALVRDPDGHGVLLAEP
jgi:catechol 2,3-dioxygenase-like lactoylglutathione lyase family enzyme